MGGCQVHVNFQQELCIRGHFAQTLTLAQTRAPKLLEDTLIKTLLEVGPMVHCPNLNKEYCIQPDYCLFFTA